MDQSQRSNKDGKNLKNRVLSSNNRSGVNLFKKSKIYIFTPIYMPELINPFNFYLARRLLRDAEWELEKGIKSLRSENFL